MCQADQQYPSVSRQNKALKMNANGWGDVLFEPNACAGEQNNWALQCSHLVIVSTFNDYFGFPQSLGGRDEVKSPMPRGA